MADPVIDLKWGLLQPVGSRPGVALRLDYRAPQVAGPQSTGHGLAATAIGSVVGERWEAHANLGAATELLPGGGVDPTVLAAVAALRAVSDSLSVGVEVVAQSALDLTGLATTATAAVVWTPAEALALSAGVGPEWEAGAGAGWVLTLGLTRTFGAP